MTTTRKGANPYDKSSKPTSPVGGDDSNKMAWIIGGAVVAVIAVIAIVVFAFSGGDDGSDAAEASTDSMGNSCPWKSRIRKYGSAAG